MERRLGRGLGSLLTQARESDEPDGGIELDRIVPNPHQPRTVFDPEGLDQLTNSIRQHGVLQPIALRKRGAGYEIISGERRWRAARAAGLERIPATVREDVSDRDMLELALVENVQRVDLNPLERAEAFRDLMQELDVTQEAVADKVGLKRATVTNHLRLLELPEAVRDMVSNEMLSMGQARAILGVSGTKERQRLAEQVVRQGLSVRETERLVRDLSQSQPAASSRSGPAARPEPWAAEMQRRIQERLGTRVTVENGRDYRGRIVIEYYGREQLDRVYAALAPKDEV